MRKTLLGLLPFLCLGAAPAAAYTIAGVGPGSWGNDAALGLGGATVENFEDTALAAGLSVTLGATVSYGPTATLPNVFVPGVNDAAAGGSAFTGEQWDGVAGLLNRGDSAAVTKYNDGGWGDITFGIAGGASLFGFAIADVNGDFNILVNGSLLTSYGGVGNVVFSNSHGGYVIIQAGPGDAPITSVKLDNPGTADGWIVDHVAFQAAAVAVPEPASLPLLLAGLGALALARRRRRR